MFLHKRDAAEFSATKGANNLVLLPRAKWWSCFIIPPFSSAICFPPPLRLSVGSLLQASNIVSSCCSAYWSDGHVTCKDVISALKRLKTIRRWLLFCRVVHFYFKAQKSTSLFKVTFHLGSCHFFKGADRLSLKHLLRLFLLFTSQLNKTRRTCLWEGFRWETVKRQKLGL